jgi:hypothetical protein
MLSVVFILAALVILVNYDSAEPTSIRQRSEDVRSLTLDRSACARDEPRSHHSRPARRLGALYFRFFVQDSRLLKIRARRKMIHGVFPPQKCADHLNGITPTREGGVHQQMTA